MSPEILTIQDCMAKVMGDVREVAKNDRNTQQNFTFRGVDAVVNAIAPALRKHAVVVLPRLESISYENLVVGKNQTHMIGARVVVTYRFVGPAGDYLEAIVAGEAMDAGDKATPKAMSVAFRIALLQALALPTDDVDPDATSYADVGPAPQYLTKDEMNVALSAAPGESTDQPTTGSTTSFSRDGSGAQAAQDAASPTLSVLPSGDTDDAAPEQVAIAQGEGRESPSGAATYLTKDEQKELITDYGSNKAVIEAYQSRFGDRIRRMEDITCDMVEAMDA